MSSWTHGLELYVRNFFNDPFFDTAGFMTTYTPYEQIFNISGDQATVSLTGAIPQQAYPILVYKNGIRLVNPTSFTIDSTGLIYTFTPNLTDGDVVIIDYWS